MQYSLRQLIDAVNAAADEFGFAPLQGQVSEALSERTARFYRSSGLLDAPEGGGPASTYGERHFKQLLAIRMLQARGVPLAKIRAWLLARSDEELDTAIRKGKTEAEATRAAGVPTGEPATWSVLPLTDDLLLISRSGKPLDPDLAERVLRALRG